MRDREALRRNGRMNQIDLSFIRPFNSVPNKGAPMVGSRSVATIVNLLTAHLLRAIAIRTAAGILTDIAAVVAREDPWQRHWDGPFALSTSRVTSPTLPPPFNLLFRPLRFSSYLSTLTHWQNS
jgi:uncharacterized protein (DUF1684 family)